MLTEKSLITSKEEPEGQKGKCFPRCEKRSFGLLCVFLSLVGVGFFTLLIHRLNICV